MLTCRRPSGRRTSRRTRGSAPGAQRPAQRVDHPVERLRDLPDLLHAERPRLRVLAAQPEPPERGAGQMTLRALGEDRDARADVRARLEVRQLLAFRPRPLSPVRTPSTRPPSTSSFSAEVSGRIVAPSPSASLGEQAPELRERHDVVAVVQHRGRRRHPQRAALRQEEHRLRLRPRRRTATRPSACGP